MSSDGALRRAGWVLRAATVLILVALGVGYLAWHEVRQLADRNKTSAERANYAAARATEGVRVSCTLLTNAIVQSGGGGQGRGTPSAAAKAQRQISTIIIGAVARGLLTAAERAELARLSLIVAKAGGVIDIPDCNEIARHPERVRDDLLRQPRP